MKTYWRSSKLLIAFAVAAIMLAGCSGSDSDAVDNTEFETGDYSVREIPFATELGLCEGESIHILDVKGDSIFVEIEKNVKNADDPMGIDRFFLADRLLIYNAKEEKIVFRKKIENQCDVSSGILLNNGIAYIKMSLAKETYGNYSLYRIVDGKETMAVSAAGSPDTYYDPQLIRLRDDDFAYTYYDPYTKEFGVNVVASDLEINPVVKLVDGNDGIFMRTSLTGNGEAYIYFYEEQGIGLFLIGGRDGLISRFQLADNERINSYCLLGHRILFSMKVLDQQGRETEKLILKDDKGIDAERKNQGTLYRMASDNESAVIATDSFFNNHIIRIDGKDEITVQELTVDDRLEVSLEGALDGTAVSIHHSAATKFLLFFYGNDLRLIEVEVK